MSKKKLIDAEMFEQKILDLGSISSKFNSGFHNTTHISTGNQEVDFAIELAMDRCMEQQRQSIDIVIASLLFNISEIIRECTYQDHPCLLCRDSDESDPIEGHGDWRNNK